MSLAPSLYKRLITSVLNYTWACIASLTLVVLTSSVASGQSCLDTLSFGDTLVIDQKLGLCELSADSLISHLGLEDCSGIVVFPAGPFQASQLNSIELLDPDNSSRKSFILVLNPLPLSNYQSGSGMSASDHVIDFPLAAGECDATKDMILDQLQVPQDDIIRSNIHFITGTQRLTSFAIGDTNYIDLIECNGAPFYTDVKIVFTPQVATETGFITFDIGLTTCMMTVVQVLERLGYNTSTCDISRFTISNPGPYNYGSTIIESIKLDGYPLVSNATLEINPSGCPPTTIFYGALGEGKCFLDEFDILDTIGITVDGKNCNLQNVEITPSGPYMETNTTITSIKINGVEVCSRAFDINYQLNNTIDEQTAMFCNDDLNISMGPDCSVTIDADNILKTGAYCFLNYNIDLALESSPSDIVLSGHRVEILQPGRYSVTITNPSTDNSCWSLVNIEDKYIEDIRCLPDTIRCYRVPDLAPDINGLGPDFPDLHGLSYNLVNPQEYQLTGGNACTISRATYVDIEVGECEGPYRKIIDRLWTFEDPNGNIDTCLQKLYIESAPISLLDKFKVFRANCIDDFVLLDENDYPTPDETGYPTVDTFYRATICGNLKINYADTPFELCGRSLKLARKWTIIDWCSDEVVYLDQVIRIEDTKAPIIITGVEDFELNSDPFICGQIDIDLPLPTYDDCDSDVTFEILYETYDENGGGILKSNGSNLRIPEIKMNVWQTEAAFDVIYILSDLCGNVAYDTTTITIRDTEPPVAVCDLFTVISVNGSGQALIRAETFDDLSVDNCSIESYAARKLEGACYVQDTFTSSVRFCCEEVGDTIMVEFRVTDKAGNFNTCMVHVLIQDKFKPIINCPDDIVLDCGTNYLDTTITGSPSYRDNCNSIELIYVDEEELDACGQGTIKRQWSIIDRGGFEELCVQIITLKENDPFGLDDIQWPENVVVNGCQATLEPDVLGRPILDMENCVSVDASHTDLPFYNVEDACVKILREWTVVDWCQLNDKTPGDGIWKNVQIIKVVSETGPEFSIRPIEIFCIQEDACETEITISGDATDGDACTPDDELIWSYELYQTEGNTFIKSGSTSEVNAILSEGNYFAIFNVMDACDNPGIDTLRIEVIDCTVPVLDCPAVQPSMVLSNVGIASLDIEDILISATDNCSEDNDISISFDRQFPITTKVFSCEDIPDGISAVHFVQIYVSDDAGNIDSCEVMVQLYDNSNNVCQDTFAPTIDTAMLSGLITTANLMEMENVEVTITGPTKTYTTTTDQYGEYQIEELSDSEEYIVSLSKEGPILDGVSTSDIVLIQRHLLGLKSLSSNYNIIAADVNNNGSISGTDLVIMRNALLGRTHQFPNGQKVWRFVDASQTWDRDELPFPFDDKIKITPTAEGIIDVDFMAIKIGDVNNSNRISRGLSSKSRSTVSIEAISNGNQIDFISTETTGLYGLQLALNVAGNSSSLLPGVISLTEDNYNYNEDGLLISWNQSQSPLKVMKGDILFSLTEGSLSELNSSFTSEWIANDFSVSSIQLLSKSTSKSQGLQIISNHPNPFTDYTEVDFKLSTEGKVQIELVDLAGRVLLSSSDFYTKGENTFRLDPSTLSINAGVYILKFSTSYTTAIHKVTLVK